MLQTRLFLSSAYHLETDGATERTNQTVEAMLQAFVSNHQEQWAGYLFLMEFALNNAKHSATCVGPFFFNYGLNLRTQTSAALPTHGMVQTAQEYVAKRIEAQRWARDQALQARSNQAMQADKRRWKGGHVP